MSVDISTKGQTRQQVEYNRRIIAAHGRAYMPSLQAMTTKGNTVHDVVDALAEPTSFTPNEGRHARIIPASSVRMIRPRFAYDPFLPCGTVSLIAGRAGVSKSTLSIHWAAQLTRGLLPGDWKGQPQNVAFSAIEDDTSMQRMRLEAAGADMSRVNFITIGDTRQGVTIDTVLTLPDDLPEIRDLLERTHTRVWVLDPITSCIPGDTNKRDDVRKALDPLARLAQDLDIAVVGILHFNKGKGNASDKVSGSHAFRDTVRSLILVARDDENGDCITTIDKSSYTCRQGESWSYALSDYHLTDDNGRDATVPKVTGFMPTQRSVNEVINRDMAGGGQADNERAERGEVAEWLADYLADGPVPYKEIEAAAKAEGYTSKQLSNARQRAADPWITTVRDPEYTGRGIRRLWALSATRPEQS